MEISVIGYCDLAAGYSFDASKCGIYQNGVKIASVVRTETADNATILYFELPINDSLACEVELEARLTASCDGLDDLECRTGLNIYVFDFEITPDDINLNMGDFNLDLGGGDVDLLKFLGSNTINFGIGKNVKFKIEPEGDTVTVSIDAKKSGKSKSPDDPKKGYEKNNSKTYLFQFKKSFKDSKGTSHTLTYNIRFARGTQDDGYYYYRCYVYEGSTVLTGAKLAEFYGVVNSSLTLSSNTRRAQS